MSSTGDITRLLTEARSESPRAAREPLPLVYEQLRAIARQLTDLARQQALNLARREGSGR